MDYRQELVNAILAAFRDMGATEPDLASEEQKLATDDAYLASWEKAIHWPKPEGHGALHNTTKKG